jgi:hypothetical protein
MHRLTCRRAPAWFVVLVAVAFAVALRVWAPSLYRHDSGGALHDPPALAFWAFLIAVVEVLWKGVEVAGKVALAILQYSVQLLWRFATLIAKGVGEAAQFAWKGLRAGWQLLKDTYTHVLKPAWQFFWKWVDKIERWLERTFGPLMAWLRRVRAWLLDFWAVYIRPILDLLDISRRALRVLGALGLEWARALDQKIADLEERIEAPFRALVAKVNDVINIVNRIMTADGLFQRLTFLKTLARDYAHAWSVVLQGFNKPLTNPDRDAMDKATEPKPLADVRRDVGAYLRDRSGADAALFTEVGGQWRKYLRGQQ